MGKYSSRLLRPEIEPEREYTPTGGIDTRTAKPETQWTPTGEPGPGLGTLVKSGFVDDMETKMRIFAEARGIPMDRYAIVPSPSGGAEIVYQADDGNWYPETKQTPWDKLKRAGGETVAHAPSIALGTAGSTVNPFVAGAGAGFGELIRKNVGKHVFDEPQSDLGNLMDMGGEAALAFVPDVLGRGTGALINKAGAKRGGTLAAHAGAGRDLIDKASTKKLEDVSREVGIDLYPPQTTGSKMLTDKFNLLGDLEASGNIIQTARKKQQKQIQDAVDTFLNDLSPSSEGSFRAGQNLVKAADRGIGKLKRVRSDLAKPYYDKAKKVRGVDISGTIKKLDDVLADAPDGSSERMAVGRIKRMLTRDVKDPKGRTHRIPQDKLVALDKVKKEINARWKKDPTKAPDKDTQRSLNGILKDMLKQVDEQVPEYAKARQVYKTASPYVDQYSKSIVGDISKLDGDKVVQASRRLFGSVGNSPETVAKARRLIAKNDPDAWNSALKTHIGDVFEKQKASAGGVDISTNIGGMFFKRTFGDPKQRKILKAAMDMGQWSYFEKLSTVLERTGSILRRESATATRQQMIEDIGGSALQRSIRAATRPLYTKERIVGDWFINLRLARNAKALANAMVDQKAAKQLDKMFQLSPKSKKLIPMMSTFIGMTAGGEMKRSHQRTSYAKKLLRARGSGGQMQ